LGAYGLITRPARKSRRWKAEIWAARTSRLQVGHADIVVDVVIEIGCLQTQGIACFQYVISLIVEAGFPCPSDFWLEIRIRQKGEGCPGGMHAIHQCFRDGRRTVSFRIGAVELQTAQRSGLKRRDA